MGGVRTNGLAYCTVFAVYFVSDLGLVEDFGNNIIRISFYTRISRSVSPPLPYPYFFSSYYEVVTLGKWQVTRPL